VLPGSWSGFTRPMPHVSRGIPIITAKNIFASRISFNNADLTTQTAFDDLSDKDRPRIGEILLTKDGSIGRAAIVETSEPFCINQSVAVLRFGGMTAHVPYLLRVIESPHSQGSSNIEVPAALGLLAARYVGNRPNPLCWNDPFPFQQGIEAIGCEVLERLNFPGRPADLQRLNLLCRP